MVKTPVARLHVPSVATAWSGIGMAAAALLIANVVNDQTGAGGIQAAGTPPGVSTTAASGPPASARPSSSPGPTGALPTPTSAGPSVIGPVRDAGHQGHGAPSPTLSRSPTAIPSTPSPSPSPSPSGSGHGTVLADLAQTIHDAGRIVVAVVTGTF